VAERTFLDTNVLVYVFDADAASKQERAQRILAEAPAEARYVLSAQVLQEFYVVVTRKLDRPLAHEDAAQAVRALSQLPVAQADASSVLAAIDRVGRLGMSLWDSLIVQAALESGCTRLLTEDLQDGQVVDGVRVENPFRE
jgi:predicted nucleic acid-binding protein